MKIELIKWVDTFGCSQGWEFEDEIGQASGLYVTHGGT